MIHLHEKECCQTQKGSNPPPPDHQSGPSCSKLTTSLVKDSLKFTSSDTQICWIFCWKNVSSFCSAKATHIFSAKNIRILYIESAKIVNEMALNELVKLTTLWTTGPRCADWLSHWGWLASMLDKNKFQQMTFFLVFPRNSLWHIMHIIASSEGTLQERSKCYFLGIVSKIFENADR